ncbi:MAG: hypothetical protein KF690_07530 [Bacteroidetes bacterium]|nr:hypothetical protein [Bacteroidota bacterium]
MKHFPWIFLALVWGACTRELKYDRPGPEYFPLQEGLWRVYQVIDTSFTATTTTTNPYGLTLDLKPHYRMEKQGSQELDQMGRTLTRLETYRTPDTSAANYWEHLVFDELWTLHRNNEFAERIEANIRYQVMAFPIRVNRRWDGNAYNTRNAGPDQQLYTYVNTDTTVTVHGRTYTRCVFIRQRKSNTLLFDVDTYEIYAPGVGLIKRYDRSIIYDDVNLSSLTTDSYIRIQTLVEHN